MSSGCTSTPVPRRSPATRWSIVLAAGTNDSGGREALAWLFRQYWHVLRQHAARRGWRDSDDVVQDFFTQLIQRGSLAQVDRCRGRFRSWLLTCLDHHLANHAEALTAQRRGGGLHHQDAAVCAATAPEVAPEVAFDREWALTVLAGAQERLTREAATDEQRKRLEILRPFLASPGDLDAYTAAGLALGIPEGAVKVAVHRLRTRFREQVETVIAETLESDDPREIAAELDHLLTALRSGV